MEAEHCFRFDSMTPFTTTNYQVTTTPKDEWTIVLMRDEAKADMRHHRVLPDLDQLAESDVAKRSKITNFEALAIVLYTGPLVISYEVPL
jgi:hypothetical protein